MSWAPSETQSPLGLQRHMKSHRPLAVTGYSSLTPYPASLTQQFNFWNLIHAQACCAARTHRLLKDQVSEHYFDGNAVILAHLNIYILLPYVPHMFVEGHIQLRTQNQHQLPLYSARLNNPWTHEVCWQASLFLSYSPSSYATIFQEMHFHFHLEITSAKHLQRGDWWILSIILYLKHLQSFTIKALYKHQ